VNFRNPNHHPKKRMFMYFIFSMSGGAGVVSRPRRRSSFCIEIQSSADSEPARRKIIRRGFKSRPSKKTNTSEHRVIQDIGAGSKPACPKKNTSEYRITQDITGSKPEDGISKIV
jgi:hypothetical protein